MFLCSAMSWLWAWAAWVSFSFTFSGAHPAFWRSLLASSTTRAAASPAGAAEAEALGEVVGVCDALAAGRGVQAVLAGRSSADARCQKGYQPLADPDPPPYAVAAVGTPTAAAAMTAMDIFR
ncbi:hypothetical protein GCM10010420_53280 [Streptomyces glaucosporus]|uniref:Secreted protein n=1 Tax=Streptomyces glaucosporus TaxID=284044 RepID=A0ABN3IZ31_9ACTN